MPEPADLIEANAAFYAAFEARDLDAMSEAWLHEDHVACTHPGWATLQGWPAVAAYALVEIARIWVMASLGRYWTTRILIPRDAPLVRRGPYRFLRHPNYWVVGFEIALLPLALGSWGTAAVFSLLNAAVLFWRIRVEESSLAPRRNTA